MIYFDFSATSPIDDEVLEAMLPYLREEYGNPSSKYYSKASNAKKAVEESREKVARLVGAKPDEIIFTSGATESTNFVIKGYLDYQKYYGDGRNHIITSVAEHKATLNVCKFLNGNIYSNNDSTTSLFAENKRVNRGYEVSFVNVNKYGQATVDEISKNINDKTTMVSIMYVNNEIGTINDINSIAQLCNSRNISFHTDITQALGKTKIAVNDIGCDFMSFSAHKIYGPKGIGGTFIKSDAYGIPPITAFMHGGEQEDGFRAGTLSVHNIVGFGKAAEIAFRDLQKNEKEIIKLDEYFVNSIKNIPELSLAIDTNFRFPGIISLIVNKKDFNNERFIKYISDEFALSTGSACSAGEPSHVLREIGKGNLTNKVIRVSIGKYTTQENLDSLIKVLKNLG